MSKRCSSVTVSLIPFLSIDIQLVSLVIYARFLHHYGITTLSQAIWMENRNCAYTHLYSSVLQITKSNKYPISILINHSIILCKNGYKIN